MREYESYSVEDLLLLFERNMQLAERTAQIGKIEGNLDDPDSLPYRLMEMMLNRGIEIEAELKLRGVRPG